MTTVYGLPHLEQVSLKNYPSGGGGSARVKWEDSFFCRHPRVGGDPVTLSFKTLDSRVRGNDGVDKLSLSDACYVGVNGLLSFG